MSKSNKSDKLKVAIVDNDAPFSTCRENIDGLSVYIWKKVAEINKLDYEFVCIPRNVDKAIEDLNKDKYDVLLGPISITEDRFHKALFSRPYYLSKLKIHRKRTENIFKKVLNNEALHYIFILMGILISVFSLAMTYYTGDSIQSSFYNTFLSFFSNIREFIVPEKGINPTHFNYAFVVIRYLFFTIVMTQLLNIVLKSTTIITEKELTKIKEVHTIAGSSYIGYIRRLGMKPVTHPNAYEIVKLLAESNENIYWFDDTNSIQQTTRNSKYNLETQSNETELITDEFAIVVNNKHPNLLKKISHTIVSLEGTGVLKRACKDYVGEDNGSCL